MTTDNVNIYDSIPAHTVEDGDQVIVNHDMLVNVSVSYDGIDVLITGDSQNTGDRETYKVDPDTFVDLWSI